MTLEKYLERIDALSLTALAGEIGVSKSRLSQLRKSKDWPPELAIKVEAATGGKLDASLLSPVIKLARKPREGEAA